MKQAAFPGDEIRARREELGLSLEQVIKATHIPRRCIVGFENGSLRDATDGCYAIGFLRTYCTFLGLDSERYLNIYRLITTPQRTFFRRKKDIVERPPAWLSDAVTWLAVCGILLLVWVAYGVVMHVRSDAAEHRVQAGTIERTEQARPGIPGQNGTD